MSEPLISVIIPVYNMEKYLHRCLDSVITQTYQNLQIILVDDGSKDQSPSICDEYAKRDERIVVIHKKNAGVSEARNTGLDVATGAYIAFVDSDDYLMPDMYESLYRALIENKADVSVCQWQYEQNDGTLCVDHTKVKEQIYGMHTYLEFERLLALGGYENGIVCSPWNKLLPREAFEDIRFYGDIHDDEEMNDKVIAKGYSFFVTKDIGYVYCQNGVSITNQKFNAKRFHFFDVLESRMRLFADDEQILKDTRILYFNIYIEYYFQAKKNGVSFPDTHKKAFTHVYYSLLKDGCSFKTAVRGILFLASPTLYKKVTEKK